MNTVAIDHALDGMPLVPVPVLDRDATLGECLATIDATGIDLVALDPCAHRVVDTRVIAHALADGAPLDSAAEPFVRLVPHVGRNERLVDVVAMLANAEASVVVVEDDGEICGALRLREALTLLLHRPQWVGALRVALHIEASE